MKSIQDYQFISSKYKSYIWRYFFDRRHRLSKFLIGYQKHELNTLLLLSIDKPAELSLFIGGNLKDLERIINTPVYNHYQVEKKKGGKRDIYAPDDELKKILKKLNYFLQAYYLCVKPNEVHGFVINPAYLGRKCNIVANASVHTNRKYVLNIDLKDFFSNISAQQVYKIFSSHFFNYSEQISIALTLLTTYEGKLPTGAPTSPVISNFVCFDLDSNLKQFAEQHALSYTRYADDITFSSDEPIIKNMISNIIRIIEENNFAVNYKKLRISTSNRKQTVTGITVNESVNVDRKLLKKVRAMLYDAQTNGIYDATQKHFKILGYVDKKYRIQFIDRLQGYINFVGQVTGTNSIHYLKFKRAIDGILESN